MKRSRLNLPESHSDARCGRDTSEVRVFLFAAEIDPTPSFFFLGLLLLFARRFLHEKTSPLFTQPSTLTHIATNVLNMQTDQP
ncbi:membrane-associated protein, putative [Bodo saltans]|uniref:Membrane-associated protein, putative n=1 Tax=Bodo saltans TaxID=75058 RepID=A0A0S4JV32_BODSA|nr:membrane-associated protein, putative [Bodo saltans]|eukprot:CUG92972.1 membrane-associated protein, putative [Bodo saltans]